MLDVSTALKNPGQEYPINQGFEIEDMTVLDEVIKFTDVNLDADYFSAEGKIAIKGTITATCHAHCANCLEPVEYKMSVDVDDVFSRSAKPMETEEYPIEGYSIALEPLVKDRLLLDIPMRFLCKDDCLGLCPVCGSNRNTNPCTCLEGVRVTNPFSALGTYFNVDNNEEV